MGDGLNSLQEIENPFQFVTTSKPLIDAELERFLGEMPTWPAAQRVLEIMRYAIFAGGGGKRVRPALALFTGRCLGTPMTEVLEAAAAIELLHSYTLIIDDIQDGDEIRRGEPATHVKYGINLSLLAASRLLFEGTSRLQRRLAIPVGMLRKILHLLHAGQEADIESENWLLSERTNKSIEFIFLGKTGALFSLSCISALGSRSAEMNIVERLAEIGSEIGISALLVHLTKVLSIDGNLHIF